MSKTFLVIGAGKFGGNLARTLFQDGQEVMTIDRDAAKINDISDYVTHALIGDTTDERVLENVGVRDFDYVIISLAGDVRASVITTVLCKELGARYVIAKASDSLHQKLLEKTGADMVIQPEREMGTRLAKSLVSDNIIDYLELSDKYSIHEIKVPRPWIGRSLMELDVRKKFEVSVIGIRRNEEILLALDPNDSFKADDVLILMGANSGLERISLL